MIRGLASCASVLALTGCSLVLSGREHQNDASFPSDGESVDAPMIDGGVDSGGCLAATPECTPLEVEVGSVECGNCGTQEGTRTCTASCTWGPWENLGPCTGDIPVIDVTAHALGGCARLMDQSLWCWGENDPGFELVGQVGVGDLEPRQTPTRVGSALWAEAAGAWEYMCGRQTAGGLYCWGLNSSGQLGIADADTMNRLVPTRVGTESSWTDVAGFQYHTCGVRNDNTLWCWGANWNGQLGLGPVGDAQSPQQVTMPDVAWTKVAAGISHTCAIGENDSLYCWGTGTSGQLGLGTMDNHNTPQQVPGTWAEVAAGEIHTCARKTDNTLWCWGANGSGQLGLGDRVLRSTPHQVGSAVTWTQLSLGYRVSCGRQGGRLYCWGSNGAIGNLGVGDYADRTEPTEVVGALDWTHVAINISHSCGIQSDGSLWCWGHYLRIGLANNTEGRVLPTRVGCFRP